jgi:DNA polymerase-3 subunit alpha
VVVGSELLNQYASLIKEDQLLVMEGRVSNDDFSGGIRVTARKIFNVASARSHFASMLKISCNGQSDAVKLTTILSPYCKKAADSDKKLCPVKIEYHNSQGQASLMLGEAWRVELQDELLQNLHAWLSVDNVKILYN